MNGYVKFSKLYCCLPVAVPFFNKNFLFPANMAPERRADISRCGIRALIAGSVSCFMTACIAGIVYSSQPLSLFDI